MNNHTGSKGKQEGTGEFETSGGKVERVATGARSVSVNDAGRVVGEDHHRAVLSDHDIWLIHELDAEGLSLTTIAAKFEISKGAVHDYLHGRRRGQTAVAQRTLPPPRPRRRFA